MDKSKKNEHEAKAFVQLTETQNSFPFRSIGIIIIAAIMAFILFKVLPYSENTNKGLALLFFIATMWLSEAVHITITALMIPILGVLIGIGKFVKEQKIVDGVLLESEKFVPVTIKTALASFANPTIYIFFGGFALAAALHVQKLDRKVANWLISLSGGKLGVSAILICLATALLSMWVSNTATAAIMLPLALGIISNLDDKQRGTKVFILLGIAYSASIGGLGTIVGSPPNNIASEALNWSFQDWMKVGFPIMMLILPLMLVVLYFVFKPKLNQKIQIQLENIPWTRDRILTTIVFCITAILWIFSKQFNGILKGYGFTFALSDAWIAVGAAITIVTIGLATWKEVSENTEWGVLLLFGGGLSLSAMLGDSGAALALGNAVADLVGDMSKFLVVFIVAIFIIAITEFTSNTASAALLVPVFAAVAEPIGLPKETLIIIIGIGASCAFVMPVATPPNALVFGTGQIKQSEMVKGGLILAFLSAFVLAVYTYIFYA